MYEYMYIHVCIYVYTRIYTYITCMYMYMYMYMDNHFYRTPQCTKQAHAVRTIVHLCLTNQVSLTVQAGYSGTNVYVI